MAGDAVAEGESRKAVGVVLRSSAKTVHFIRHAEGTHNKAAKEEGREAYDKEEHFDARLTDFGNEQCAALKATGHGIEKEAQLVVVSPLTRAIETAIRTVDQVDGVPWIALECVRERSGNHPCDRRRSIQELKLEFPNIDFDAIEDDTDVHWASLNERETNEALTARGHELLEWISSRPETNIAVVTHSAYLLCLFNNAILSPPHIAKWFENCELRTVLLDV